MCIRDRRDLGRSLGDRSDEDGPPGTSEGAPGFDPTLFLYDQVPGGVGLAGRLFEEREALCRRTRALIEGCACELGCPACIGPDVGIADPGANFGAQASDREPTLERERSRKRIALDLLQALGIGATH